MEFSSQPYQKLHAQTYRGVIMHVTKTLVFAIYLALYIAAEHHGYPEIAFFRNGYYLLYLLYTMTLLLLAKVYHPFWVGEQRIRELCLANALMVSLLNALAYGYLSLLALEMLPVLPVLILTVAQMLCGCLFIILRTRLFYCLYPPVSAVYIYADEAERLEMLARFHYEKARFRIVEQITQRTDEEKIFRCVDANHAVIVGRISMELRDRLMRYSYDTQKDYYLAETIADVKTRFGREISVYDMQLIKSKAHGFSIGLRICKRAMDIICSLLGLLLFGLPILICALIIRLQDGGNPFYKQERLTRDGNTFTLIKLRSMVMNAEKDTGAVISSNGDTRVTRFGKFLRATHIDELPQFLNVLHGDLSLVGPRPERPELHVDICTDYPYFHYRLLVKAGMTGYAQVYGRYDTPPHQKLRMDMRYIETASIGLDVRILVYTLLKVFVKETRIEAKAELKAETKDSGKEAVA